MRWHGSRPTRSWATVWNAQADPNRRNPTPVFVADPAAGPLWGRFYDLEKCEIYVCDRDGIPRKSLEEIGHERRNGYSWYNDNPLSLYPVYDKWADLNDPDGKVRIDMSLVNKAEARGQKRR